MAIIGSFSKQPREVHDYLVQLAPFFSNRGDELASYQVLMPTGITLLNDQVVGTDIVLLISGGTSGTTYKVQILVTTTTGVITENEINIAVLEV